MPRFWKCNACGTIAFWGPDWNQYSSLRIEDECPGAGVITCSAVCKVTAQQKIESKEWILPRIGKGLLPSIKPPIGYQPQPSQRQLLTEWNERQATFKQPPA